MVLWPIRCVDRCLELSGAADRLCEQLTLLKIRLEKRTFEVRRWMTRANKLEQSSSGLFLREVH